MFWNQFPIIKDEMSNFEDYLQTTLVSNQVLIQKAISDLAQAGGKRIRPALIIASAHFGEYKQQKVWNVAAAMEMMHMATLIHDDIIDDSNLRRGTQTAQAKYGKDTAVFAGDYLFSLTFSVLSGQASQEQLQKVAEIVQKICEGEVQQQQDRYDYSISYKEYFKRIKYKTAILFEGSCLLGAGLGKVDKSKIQALRHYGRYLGMAFQLTDDVLDFNQQTDVLGKPDTNDFTQGIYTLPILYVIQESKFAIEMKNLLDAPVENSQKIKSIVRESGGLEYALDIAKDYVIKAKKKINSLPTNEYQNLLWQLADKVLKRNF